MKNIVELIRNNWRNGINPLWNRIVLWKNRIAVPNKMLIRGRIVCRIAKGGKLTFGNGCKINSAKWANIIGGDTRTAFVVKPGAKIEIGNNVGISNSTFVAQTSIIIEEDVMIGGDCKIYDTDFHAIDYETRMEGFSNTRSFPVLIKKGAFIGAHSIVLKGVTVGEKSIVGAGSVVTKSIPDGEIWAGNPAQLIKKLEIK